MTIELFIISALATYGLAYTVARLEGPLNAFVMLREVAGRSRHAWIYHGVNCEICLSFWLGIPMALIVAGVIPHAVAYWLGYVGFAVFANVVLARLRVK